jgi:WXG100 family type VII secretion target
MDFQVKPEHVSQAASSCESIADEISGQLASLKSYVVNIEAWWGGIAATTFQELMCLYDTCSASLNQALIDIGKGLQGNYVNYYASEQANLAKLENELSGAHLG